MEALEIERQTDQTPLASRRCPTQGEPAEAEYLFDDPDHRSVDFFLQVSPSFKLSATFLLSCLPDLYRMIPRARSQVASVR